MMLLMLDDHAGDDDVGGDDDDAQRLSVCRASEPDHAVANQSAELVDSVGSLSCFEKNLKLCGSLNFEIHKGFSAPPKGP